MHTFVAGFKTAWPLVVAAMLGLVAYFHARGFSELISAELGAPVPMRRPAAPAALPSPTTNPAPILKRNPFDSTTGPLDGTPPLPPPVLPSAPRTLESAEKCTFGHVTTIVTAPDDYTFAAIKTQDGKSGLHRIGDTVAAHRVMRITRARVWLDEAGKACQMRLGDPIRVRKKPARKRTKRPTRKRRSKVMQLPGNIRKRIEKVSATRFRIERSAMDDIIEKQAQLLRRTRIRRVEGKDGVAGVRVRGVSRGTLLDSVGIQSGDVIRSINGYTLADPQKALEAYGRLQMADELTVQVERKGKLVSIAYEIM